MQSLHPYTPGRGGSLRQKSHTPACSCHHRNGSNTHGDAVLLSRHTSAWTVQPPPPPSPRTQLDRRAAAATPATFHSSSDRCVCCATALPPTSVAMRTPLPLTSGTRSAAPAHRLRPVLGPAVSHAYNLAIRHPPRASVRQQEPPTSSARPRSGRPSQESAAPHPQFWVARACLCRSAAGEQAPRRHHLYVQTTAASPDRLFRAVVHNSDRGTRICSDRARRPSAAAEDDV